MLPDLASAIAAAGQRPSGWSRDWDAVPVEELPGAAVELSRLRAQVDAALLRVADRLEETDAAAAYGWAGAGDFLTHVTGGRKGAGGGLLRVAKQTRDLPGVRAAMAEGSVSLSQARAIAGKVATLPRDPGFRERVADRMVELAVGEGCDATDLDHAFLTVVRDADPDGRLVGEDKTKEKVERGAHQARHLSFSPDALGGVKVSGYGTVEDAETIKATLLSLAAPQATEPGACGGDPDQVGGRRDEAGRRVAPGCPDPVCAHDGRDPRDPGARTWDALVEACRLLQAGDDLPHAHGTTARLTVTVGYDDLHDRLEGLGYLPGGQTLSAAAVRRLACDAELIPGVLGAEGQVLDLGRAQRLVSTAIWLALVLRDQCCTFPGCTRLPIACDAHHLIHWADGGPTSLDNLVLLCRRHHTLTHRSPWTVHLDPHTRRPVWAPPPAVDDRDHLTHHHPAARAGPAPPRVA